jgi:FkbM family methyltransferase
VYYDRFLQPSSIRLIEPNPVAIELLRLNLEANMVKSADTTWLGVAAGREFGLAAVYTTHAHNLGAARLRPADQGDVEVQPLDAMEIDAADFIKIDVEGMELDVLEGARQLIRRCRPALLIEVARENLAAFDAWREAEGYTVVQEFPYVNAVNLYLEARR